MQPGGEPGPRHFAQDCPPDVLAIAWRQMCLRLRGDADGLKPFVAGR